MDELGGVRVLSRGTKERGRAITAVVLGALAALAVVAAVLVAATFALPQLRG